MSKLKASHKKALHIMKSYLIMLLLTFKWIFIIGLVAGIFGAAAAYGYVTSLVQGEPIRDKEMIREEIQKNTVTGFVFFNDGTEVGQLRGIDRRLVDKLEDVPQTIRNAFLAVEDTNFEHHIGVDIKGTMRAIKQEVLNESTQTGGSTITQQVARNVFLSLDRTRSRKAKEILLAIRLERVLTKEEIFLAYLNKIPFGNGSSGYNVYGIKAAAEGIFGVDSLEQINIAQAAYLAGLPKNPPDYSAFDGYGRFDEEGFKNAIERMKIVLYRMHITGKITDKEYEDALAFDIRSSLAEPSPKAYSTYPFLMIEAERKAAEILLKLENPELATADFRNKENAQLINDAREQLLGKGYKIYTTIDKTIYDAMQEIASNPENFTPDHEEKGVEQVGAIMIDNRSGAILGMIEGRDFYTEQLNHATQMVRQPGSTTKTIAAFLPALEEGLIQPATPIDDSPIYFKDGGKGWHLPNNWNVRFQGLVSARYALAHSLNIPALRLFNDVVTIPKAWDFVSQLGITTLTENDDNHKTGVIGGLDYGMTVEELTNAYAAIPNNGEFLDAYMISKIEDSQGNIIYEHTPEPVKVFSEETAFLMSDMMKSVISYGTGGHIRSTFKHYQEIEVAGKTGSTQNDENMWFMGYSPDITVGVWTGYDQPARVEYSHGAQRRAMEIWSKVMDAAIELKPELFPTKSFNQPENVIRMTVSGITGLLPSAEVSAMGKLTTDYFNRQYIPTREDDSLESFRYVRYKGLNYLPGPNTPEDMVKEKVFVKRELNIYELLAQIDTILKELKPQFMPKKHGRNMTLYDYYPEDVALTAPQFVVPEEDDDGPPAPPTELNATSAREGKELHISFTSSKSADVLGYRIYRSTNQAPFVRMNGKVVLQGEHATFYVPVSPGTNYAFYIVAVDAHGNESQPSEIIYSDPDAAMFPVPPMPGDDDTEAGDDNDGNEGSGETGEPNESGGTDESGQNGSRLPSAPAGISLTSEDTGVLLEISWQPSPDTDAVRKYEIYYSESEDGAYTKIGETNIRRFYHELPQDGWYRVVAVNAFGSSQPSAPVQYTSGNSE